MKQVLKNTSLVAIIAMAGIGSYMFSKGINTVNATELDPVKQIIEEPITTPTEEGDATKEVITEKVVNTPVVTQQTKQEVVYKVVTVEVGPSTRETISLADAKGVKTRLDDGTIVDENGEIVE